MKVRDHMASDVTTLGPDDTLQTIAETMATAGIRHIPIVDDRGRLVGIVTHRDVLNASLAIDGTDAQWTDSELHRQRVRAEEVMTANVVTIAPDATVQEAARSLRGGRFGCLPVVTTDDEVVGMLSQMDLLAILERLDPDTVPVTAPSARG